MDPKPFWLLAQDPRGKPQVRRRLCLALLVLNWQRSRFDPARSGQSLRQTLERARATW